jgi:hypothetical protein
VTEPLRESRSTFGVVTLTLASVVCLTLLFTAQDVMRRSANGAPVNWSQSFAINAHDWVVWGILLPFVIAVGRRIRLGGTENRVARILGWVALGVTYCAIQSAITGLVMRYSDPQIFGFGPPPGAPARPLGAFLWSWGLGTASLNMLIFGMTMGAFHATLYYRDVRQRQLREVDLEARLARAELNSLRTQLQPHFLFNALHTVSSLMVSDVAAAQGVVSALGDLLRASLDHTAQQEIPLRDELAFVGRYLDVQRARFRSRIGVELSVPDGLLDALVPSLVLQPLVENAVRHAIEPNAEGGRIWITASRANGDLALVVRNDGVQNGRDPAPASGIGLANLEARLKQLYGPSHTFRASRSEAGEFVVVLTLPFHAAPPVP